MIECSTLSTDGQQCLPTVSQRTSGLPSENAWRSVHNCRCRQHRSNPSATTSKDSFHGTALSLIQHPSYTGEGINRSIVVAGDARSKTVAPLPHYYTDVPPVTSSIKKSPVPAAGVVSLARGDFKQQTDEEYQWLGNAKQVLEDNTGTVDNENTSWAAFHASRQPPDARVICPRRCFHSSWKVPTLWP
ncbi:hypothetical protein BSL78_28133 [Apostichopus japonicus]|uniref:Uncharacterized protein n=1 Tax=Stichopus japonicus TaxID=307972 RepID=A0A2G8JH25_STIJA|nr:hypothetical protein BSL78_28133 [Apostichopus japonicus]